MKKCTIKTKIVLYNYKTKDILYDCLLVTKILSASRRILTLQCRLCKYKAGDLSGVYRHYENSHGFRGKRDDVVVDQVTNCPKFFFICH